MTSTDSQSADTLSVRIAAFVRETIAPFETDPRCGFHGPSEDLVLELKDLARGAGLLTPHIQPDGTHLTHRQTAAVLKVAGLSPLGPVALNVAAPDEGNVYLLGKVASHLRRSDRGPQMVLGQEDQA